MVAIVPGEVFLRVLVYVFRRKSFNDNAVGN